MPEDEQPEVPTENDETVIRTQKIYIKDVSFESPNSPELFGNRGKPKLSVEMNNSVSTLDEDVYEVILTATAKVTLEDKTAFLVEVHQAGIFILKGHDPDTLDRIQHVFCLRTLYPYACSTISDLVTKGGFPQLLLAPLSFNTLYKENREPDEQFYIPADE